MEMIINPGQSLSITTETLGDKVRFIFSAITPSMKPGPKSLPKSDAKSTDFHTAVTKLLRNGKPRSADEIRAAIGGTPENKNAISWALVELQNAGARRGKNLPKTGPLVKLDDGRYQLRAKAN